MLRNMLGHRSLNAGKWVKRRLRDHPTDGLLDKVTLGQTKGVGLG
jgi:aspartate carbamoyltransferase catalytic subunit